MSKAALKSPNDSLQQQSTAYTATRFGDRSSLDATSFESAGRRLGAGGSEMGGGSYNSYFADHVKRMRHDIEATTRRLELEQRRLYRIDKDLAAAESEYGQKRQKYKLFQSAQDDVVQHKAAEVHQLERRLEKAIADLNQGAAENEQLREQIDQHRKERKILNAVFRQLERGIGGSGKVLGRLMTQINEDRLLGEEAKQKAQALNRMLERERRNFHKDVEELKKAVKEETNVQREQERGERDRGDRATAGKRRTYMIADEEEAFSEQAMHCRILKLSFLNTIQRRHIKQHQKNIEVFEQAFATIKSSTGISDIEEIVNVFIALEQRNFSLLTYVNQLNREIESIEIRNKDLQHQLGSHRQRETQSAARKDSALSEITSQITQTKAATTEKNAVIEEAQEVLDDCRPSIWNIVKFLKQEIPGLVNAGYEGDAPPMKAAAPEEQEENLNHHLMYIEEAMLQFRVCLPDAQRPQPPPKPSAPVLKKPTDLPSAHIAGDDSDEDPETGLGERMFSRAELRDRAQAVIQRRRKKPGGQQQQQGKHAEGGRGEAAEEGLLPNESLAGSASVRREPGPPPPAKEYAASSVTSKDS